MNDVNMKSVESMIKNGTVLNDQTALANEMLYTEPVGTKPDNDDASYDVNDTSFRQRQGQIQSLSDPGLVRMDQYRQALTDLHIQRRATPVVPGQNYSVSLYWNQVWAAAEMKRRKNQRITKGAGPMGGMLYHDTGTGKTNTALTILVDVSVFRSHGGRAHSRSSLRQTWNYPAAPPPQIIFLYFLTCNAKVICANNCSTSINLTMSLISFVLYKIRLVL